MRRIEPAFPDLLPLTHRLGPVPVPDGGPVLDPVEMRLVRSARSRQVGDDDRTVPRRPVRVLVHGAVARAERAFLQRLVEAGSGLLIVVGDGIGPDAMPSEAFPGQIVAAAPALLPLWGGAELDTLRSWADAGLAAGVLLAVAPSLQPRAEIEQAAERAERAGAAFMVTAPLAVPPFERHRVYDAHTGEDGDQELENLLFHSDLGRHTLELEHGVSVACRRVGLAEVLPGPATAVVSQRAFESVASMLLWARRLDILDGVESVGWQLRRAAAALLAAGHDPVVLAGEDNLRVVPGFTPWVEAFARSMWLGGGEPFEGVLNRWLAL